MPLLAVALLDLHVNSCPQEHFQLPDRVCCHYCPAGWYVASNCTRNGSHVSGVKCSPCSVCANGTQTIASCARFSDTQCTETEYDKIITAPTINLEAADELAAVHAALGVIGVVLIAVMAAIGFNRCSKRSVFWDPAEEPLKTLV